MKKVLIEIPESEYLMISKSDDTAFATMADKEAMMYAIKSGKVLSEMTHGDMIMTMFPNCEVSIHEYMGIKCGVDVKIYFSDNESFTAWFPSCLWNAPYEVKE